MESIKSITIDTLFRVVLCIALASLSYFCKNCKYSDVCYGTTVTYAIAIGVSAPVIINLARKRRIEATWVTGGLVFMGVWMAVFYIPAAYANGEVYAYIIAAMSPVVLVLIALGAWGCKCAYNKVFPTVNHSPMADYYDTDEWSLNINSDPYYTETVSL